MVPGWLLAAAWAVGPATAPGRAIAPPSFQVCAWSLAETGATCDMPEIVPLAPSILFKGPLGPCTRHWPCSACGGWSQLHCGCESWVLLMATVGA